MEIYILREIKKERQRHRNKEIPYLIKVVPDVLDLVAVDVEPVERGRQQEVIKLLDTVVGYVQPLKQRIFIMIL